MNARKIILVLGIIAVVLVAAVVTVAIFFNAKFEKDSNRERTAKAREARHKKPNPVNDQSDQEEGQAEGQSNIQQPENEVV